MNTLNKILIFKAFKSGESGQPHQCKTKARVVRGSAGVGWWQRCTVLLGGVGVIVGA